jgi:hypothetical protein
MHIPRAWIWVTTIVVKIASVERSRERGGEGERERGREGERGRGREGERERGREGERERYWVLDIGWRQPNTQYPIPNI